MKRFLFAAVLALMLVKAGLAQTPLVPQPPVLVVTGNSEVMATPVDVDPAPHRTAVGAALLARDGR